MGWGWGCSHTFFLSRGGGVRLHGLLVNSGNLQAFKRYKQEESKKSAQKGQDQVDEDMKENTKKISQTQVTKPTQLNCASQATC